VVLRIGFDGAMLRAPHTGSGQYSAALLTALRAMPDLDVAVFSPEPLATEPAATVIAAPPLLRSARVRKVWWEQVGVARAARRAGVALVHIPYFAAPLRQRVPHVVTVHDVIPLLFPVYAGGRAMRAYLRLVSVGTRRAAQVITDSDCSKRDAIRVLGLDARRVTVVPLAVEAAFGAMPSNDALAAVRARLGLGGKRVVFNVAGLDVRKNVETLLRAFARALPNLPPDVALVIGGGAHGNATLYPDPQPLVRELGIGDRVIFPGPVSATEKRALYHLAACYVAPSRYEGFGLTPLEAMAAGTPVIAADASCTPEVVGDAALLVAPDDTDGFSAALVRVFTNASLAQRLSEAGRRQAESFSWERTAAATRGIYQRVANPPVHANVLTSSDQPAEMTR